MAIAKISRPSNPRSCLRYVFGSHDHAGVPRLYTSIVASTIGRSTSVASGLLRAIGRLRPNLKRHLYHVSISVPPEERSLENRDWARIGETWCSGMELENYLIVRHDNHIHIVASRIRLDGSAASDSNDYRRTEVILRQIEHQFDLLRAQSSHLLDPTKRFAHRRTRTLAETFAVAKDNGFTHKDHLRDTIDEALNKHCSVADFSTELDDAGIETIVEKNLGGNPSVLYAFRGRTYGQKSLGNGYGISGLAARGLQTVPQTGAFEEDIRTSPWADLNAYGKPTPRRKGQNNEQAVQKLRELDAAGKNILEGFRKQLPRKSLLQHSSTSDEPVPRPNKKSGA